MGLAKRRFLFDVTGLLHWYAYFSHPSGIQRVSERLANSTVFQTDPTVEFVTRVLGSNQFYRIDRDLLAGLGRSDLRRSSIARLRGTFAATMRLGPLRGLAGDLRYYHLPYAYFGLWRLEWLIESVFARGWPSRLRHRIEPAPPPGPRDVLFHPGDLFWQRRAPAALVALRTETGVRLVELVHDLFVFDNPQWFADDLVRFCTAGLSTVAPHVDRWVTNSVFVRKRLRRYVKNSGLPVRPIGVLPMGWDSFGRAAALGHPPEDKAVLKRLALKGVPFVLFVGTVEPRKNLGALLDAVEALRGELGEGMPALVVVGGGGWKSGEMKARLRRMKGVHWFRAASDADLAVLYRHARFTVAPSFSEGWGLPVQESLAHGVPCIASNGGAMPEAAHGLARLFDPTDAKALQRAMAHWIKDDAALEGARARIAVALCRDPLPTWNDAATFLRDYAMGETG